MKPARGLPRPYGEIVLILRRAESCGRPARESSPGQGVQPAETTQLTSSAKALVASNVCTPPWLAM